MEDFSAPLEPVTTPPQPAVMQDKIPLGQDAIDAIIDAKLQDAMAKAVAKLGPEDLSSGVETKGGLRDILKELALAIADISDQGTDRKRVDPRVLAERSRNHDLMVEALKTARKQYSDDDPNRPRYRLIAKVFLNEILIDPFTIDPSTKESVPVDIYWLGIPSQAMQPVNDAAAKIYKYFEASIGNTVDDSKRSMWTTSRGLTIVGSGPARRSVTAQDTPTEYQFNNGFAVANDPTKPEVFVLGTVAAPAKKQYASGSIRT